MTTAPGCTHSFPDPYPQPIDQPGDCRGCGITYQEAKDAAMTNPADVARVEEQYRDRLAGEAMAPHALAVAREINGGEQR